MMLPQSHSSEPAVAWRSWIVKQGRLFSPVVTTQEWPAHEAIDAKNQRGFHRQLAFNLFKVALPSCFMALLSYVLLLVVELNVRDAPTMTQWIFLPLRLILAMGFGVTSGVGISLIVIVGLKLFRLRLSSETVASGMYTRGIYGMWRSEAVTPISGPGDGRIVVRGLAYFWGETIEHEQGVKAEFSYPKVLTDVACGRCGEWMPLDEYDDVGIPRHAADCEDAHDTLATRVSTFLQHCDNWRASDKWRSPQLEKLRATAPQWFERTE